MKKVYVYEYKRANGETKYHKEFLDEGKFHGFGVDYEEFETGPGNYSTAIVEMPDGSVKNVPVELIVFSSDEDS